MKVLISGDWQYEMYEAAFAQGLRNAGVDVTAHKNYKGSGRSLLYRAENKYSLKGYYYRRNLSNLYKIVAVEKPDIILMWLPAAVSKDDIEQIKKISKSKVCCYIHDDPFAHQANKLSPRSRQFYWRPLINALPSYDLALFAKQLSASDAEFKGAKRAKVLRQYFVPWIHRPMTPHIEEQDRYCADIFFAGHYEPDGRDNAIAALASAGLKVNLYTGGQWERSALQIPNTELINLRISKSVRNEEYASALNGGNIGLCFMSKMNRDPYTTRCFEIPACGAVLLSERTSELAEMFIENREAMFFLSSEEMLEKALWLVSNPHERSKIALAGQRRVNVDGHSVNDRAKQFLNYVAEI